MVPYMSIRSKVHFEHAEINDNAPHCLHATQDGKSDTESQKSMH